MGIDVNAVFLVYDWFVKIAQITCWARRLGYFPPAKVFEKR